MIMDTSLIKMIIKTINMKCEISKKCIGYIISSDQRYKLRRLQNKKRDDRRNIN